MNLLPGYDESVAFLSSHDDDWAKLIELVGPCRHDPKAARVYDCEFKGRRREVMAGRSWTELFFLDEAVALAAGHRPCFLCRRDAAERFRTCWASARAGSPPSAAEIDDALHAERLERGRKRLHPLDTVPRDLPDGTTVAVGADAFTLHAGLAYRWTNDGYDHPLLLAHADWMVTPPSTVAVLSAGYQPVLHPSIKSIPDRLCDARSV